MPRSNNKPEISPRYQSSPPGVFPQEAGKLELLSAMDILRDLPEDVIEALMDKSPMRTVTKDTIIYDSSGPEVLFLLKSGKVELYRLSARGRKLILAVVEEGTFFGEMSLIDLHLEGTYAIAREDCIICILSRHDVESLMLEHPTVALRIIEVLTQRLQQTRVSLHEMTFNDLTGRVASLLLRGWRIKSRTWSMDILMRIWPLWLDVRERASRQFLTTSSKARLLT